MKRFPWGRAVLRTKFEVHSSYNCVLRTLCPNAPNVRFLSQKAAEVLSEMGLEDILD